jgi:hypothetical protein
MPADIREQLDTIKAELARQNDDWRRAMRTIAALGATIVMVPNEFLEGLDAISRVAKERQQGVRA